MTNASVARPNTFGARPRRFPTGSAALELLAALTLALAAGTRLVLWSQLRHAVATNQPLDFTVHQAVFHLAAGLAVVLLVVSATLACVERMPVRALLLAAVAACTVWLWWAHGETPQVIASRQPAAEIEYAGVLTAALLCAVVVDLVVSGYRTSRRGR